MASDPSPVLERCVAVLEASLAPNSALPGRLGALHDRLRQERFQLAALGQFKRGKSTLLNALVGASALPVGVVPLTAVPTFIASGPKLSLRISYRDGRLPALRSAQSIDEMRSLLSQFATEEGNPRNRFDIARVDVTIASPLLARGIVLIDTPGVGSTNPHNTDTALGTLPDCDAALFVLSVDPPITAVEIDYLRRIRPHVVRLIFVLNKVDYLSPQERHGAEAFLRQTLERHRLIDETTPIFSASARDALAAKESGDGEALGASGLGALETHLLSFLAGEKTQALRHAVLRKADGVLAEAESELALRVSAFELPLAHLEARAASFTEALWQFEAQRKSIGDLLAGERRRLAEQLDGEGNRLRANANETLSAIIDRCMTNGGASDPEAAAAQAVGARIEALFEDALRAASDAFAQRADAALAEHGKRVDDLVNAIRRKSAQLFAVPYVRVIEDEGFGMAQEPYWVTETWATTVLPRPDRIAEAMLPSRLKRARTRTRVLSQVDELVTRNVENLRWAIRRSLDDTFRRATTRLEQRLDDAIAATQDAIRSATDRKREQSAEVAPEIELLRRRLALVTVARSELSASMESTDEHAR
jgi:hypothetical protein